MNVERVVCIVLGLLAGFFVFGLPAFFGSMDREDRRDTSKFEIVGKYKNCDVVQYSPGFTATYQYFLHCSTPQ
jgi:hypothetical protein